MTSEGERRRARLRACVPACVRVWLCACVRACLRACLRVLVFVRACAGRLGSKMVALCVMKATELARL